MVTRQVSACSVSSEWRYGSGDAHRWEGLIPWFTAYTVRLARRGSSHPGCPGSCECSRRTGATTVLLLPSESKRSVRRFKDCSCLQCHRATGDHIEHDGGLPSRFSQIRRSSEHAVTWRRRLPSRVRNGQISTRAKSTMRDWCPVNRYFADISFSTILSLSVFPVECLFTGDNLLVFCVLL